MQSHPVALAPGEGENHSLRLLLTIVIKSVCSAWVECLSSRGVFPEGESVVNERLDRMGQDRADGRHRSQAR